MNALQRINYLRKLAKAAGVEGYNTMKLAQLEELNLEAVTPKQDPDDPFDDIDPENEGDHLADTSDEGKAAQVDATREAWLLAAVEALRPLLKQAGATVPQNVAVSVGFPSVGGRGKRIGECWATANSECGTTNHMFVSPLISDAIKVLDILVHELIHAADDGESGHRGFFAQVARAVGLEGKLTATHAGETLAVTLKDILTELGPYPHKKLNLSNRKKQSTRLLKMACADPECGVVVRTTQKHIDNHGVQWPCPCGGSMLLDGVELDEDADEG